MGISIDPLLRRDPNNNAENKESDWIYYQQEPRRGSRGGGVHITGQTAVDLTTTAS